jgi:hypothetical protein
MVSYGQLWPVRDPKSPPLTEVQHQRPPGCSNSGPTNWMNCGTCKRKSKGTKRYQNDPKLIADSEERIEHTLK